MDLDPFRESWNGSGMDRLIQDKNQFSSSSYDNIFCKNSLSDSMDITEVQVVKFEFCPCLSLERNNKISKPFFSKDIFGWRLLSSGKLELSWNFLTKFWNWNGTGTDRALVLGPGNGTELVPILVRRIGTGSRSKKNGAVTMYARPEGL